MKDSTTFVALDAHKKEHQVAMLLPGADPPQEWHIANTPRDIRRMVRRIARKAPGDVVICYEAGVCGFSLQRQIQAEGVACQVIAPTLIPVRPGDRVQTDRRSARKLAELLRAGLLTEVHPPTEAQEAVRDLVRCRETAMKDLKRVRHQLSKFLLRRALGFREGRQWTQKHLRWVQGLRLDDGMAQWVFEDYLAELFRRTERLEALTRRVQAAAEAEPYAQRVGWLRCFRGIDTLTAMTILTELHGFERFGCPRQLMSYLGLTPSEHSSGESQRRGGITKAGNGHVRRVLTEASWHQAKPPVVRKALRKRREGQPAWVIALADQALVRLHRRYWHLVHKGKLPTKAVIAVARDLVGFVWAVLYLKDKALPRHRGSRALGRKKKEKKKKEKNKTEGVRASERSGTSNSKNETKRISAQEFFAAAGR